MFKPLFPWAPLSAVTIQGAASNQGINIILDHIIITLLGFLLYLHSLWLDFLENG